MFRSTLIALGVLATLSSPSLAQHAFDGVLYPVTSPIKNAGTFNVNTRKWMSPTKRHSPQNASGVQTIFNNTCTWAAGAYYAPTGACETYIDEGEIPGADNLEFAAAGGMGASSSNNVVAFQFGYCTNFAVPDIKIGFYDSLGGRCAGFAPPTGAGQPTLASQACPAGITVGAVNPQGTAYYALGGLGLPGDATPGGSSVFCWVVTFFLGNSGFCLKSEGNGVWDNVPDLDRFNWSWDMNNAIAAGTAPSGLIVSGEPAATSTNVPPIAFGGCTYNLACNIDPLSGSPCGTGLGADDGFWVNTDGDKADGTTNTGVSCTASHAGGTSCYWFNGYPGNPFGGFWLVLVANGSCVGSVPTVINCQTAPSATQGCSSNVSTVGLPSASSPSPFTVSFTGLNKQVLGVVFYGVSGTTSIPWNAQSNLCVKAPTERLSVLAGASGNTGGGAGTCNGAFTFNFNPVIQGASPAYTSLLAVPMSAGQRVDMQAWQRDPAAVKTTNLSDAIAFFVGI